MMTRTSTWENLGKEVLSSDYQEILEKADLDYTVAARDLYVDAGNGSSILVPDKKMIVREDNNQLFGIVSSRYQICQNREAFAFVDYLNGVSFLKAGASGGMVWIIGKLDEVNVLGDKIAPHLIFQNSHDGSSSIRTTICMLRIVCQNQFVSTFRESPATINIRHAGDVEEKLLVARETMQGVYDYVKSYDSLANNLVKEKVTSQRFDKLVEEYFKIDVESTDRVKNFVLDRREKFYEAYNADDNQNFKGTKWGVINAFSDLITHEEAARKTATWENNRFLNSLSPSTMNEFLRLVEAA